MLSRRSPRPGSRRNTDTDKSVQLEVDVGENPAIVVTYGPIALREYIHPCAQRDKLNLQNALHSYVDIALDFNRKHPQHAEDELKNVHEVASHFGIDIGSEQPQGLKFCRVLLNVMQQMPPDGTMQTIQSQYSHVPSSTPVQEDTIVRVQGFNPNTNEFKLARFFAGLNIESGGILLCLAANGRCEALVRFTNKEQRDLALKRSGMKFGTKSIEISKASAEEFARIMNQDQNGLPQALQKFLNLGVTDSVIVRMRGLPYNTKASEIISFFGEESPVFHDQKGILFVYHPDGRPTGDAFVLFENSEHGKLALTKHRETIGKRYVELFQMSKREVVQVFTRHTAVHNGTLSYTAIRGMRTPGSDPANPSQTDGNLRHILRLRGLPYSATMQDILDFLKEYSQCVIVGGVHMVYSTSNKPTGDAFVEMKTVEYAQQASADLHKKHMRERYIEVFQCSRNEMNMMLATLYSGHRYQNLWFSNTYSPHTPPHVPAAITYPSVSTSYPTVSSPPHSSTSPLTIMSVPSSPTVSPRVYMTSPGYMNYPSPSYNVFNFSYPPPTVPVEGSIAHTPPMISPAGYDNPAVFFPSPTYQIPNDYAMTPVDSGMYVPVNPYFSRADAYYPQTIETHPELCYYPAYVETHSG